MKKVDKIYEDIILNGFYDESWGMNPKIIDGKTHGVCIDFSRELIKEMKENGYLSGLISTLNSDGFMHAAVIYYNPETNKINIADPVTDIRALTGLSDEERKKQIKEILANKNFERDLREYFDEFGPITEYDDSEYEKDMKSSPKPRRKDLIDREEIEANPDLTDIEKKSEAIQALTRLDQVKNVADGPSLLACQTLYKKGISTYCTNHVLETGYTSINIPYNSLSNENKEILQDLIKRNPDNYYIHKMTGFYSDLDGENAEISGNKPMELVLGFIEMPNMNSAEINLKMNELVKHFKKQTYLNGVYTREDILNNKHNQNSPYLWMDGYTEEPSNSSEENSNEQIALNEKLLYSKKYNMFFESQYAKSRYIESLYREEHDWRTEEEISEDNGVFYSEKYNMFFEDEREAQLYEEDEKSEEISEQADSNEDYEITPTDIAITTKKAKNTLVQKFKNIFERIRDMWR